MNIQFLSNLLISSLKSTKEQSKSARFKKGYRKAGPNEGLSEKSSSSYLS